MDTFFLYYEELNEISRRVNIFNSFKVLLCSFRLFSKYSEEYVCFKSDLLKHCSLMYNISYKAKNEVQTTVFLLQSKGYKVGSIVPIYASYMKYGSHTRYMLFFITM